MNDYTANGFANRRAYLESLCEEYDRDTVMMLAGMLGPSEDFDGLVTALEDGESDYSAVVEAAMPQILDGVDYRGRTCILVDDNTGEPIARNSVRGDRGLTVMGGRPPQHGASTGRVWTIDDDGHRGEFFPSVVGARWSHA